MNKIYYSIRINVPNKKNIDKINEILEVKSISKDFWYYELVQEDKDDYIDFIEIFTNILIKKINLLDKIGVKKGNISIWILCNFKNQCNLEFTPEQIAKLSKLGIGFCISCY